MLPVKFGSIWHKGFREDENVKVYKWQMPNDDKSSYGLCPGELIKSKPSLMTASNTCSQINPFAHFPNFLVMIKNQCFMYEN